MQKPLTPHQRRALKNLAARRKKTIPWFEDCFPEQRDFLSSKARMRAALCTRRAGKSWGAGVLACKTAYETHGVTVAIIGKTRESIKDIYLRDIMEQLNKRYDLGMELNKTELVYTFPNGSTIKFAGADSDEDQMNKFLGQKFALVILDEASMYKNIDLRDLVYAVLRPALADHRGHMVMIGTPSNYINSLYFDVTKGKEPGWEVHKWTASDNPHMKEQVAEEIAFMRSVNPAMLETAQFKQHWLGEWVVDDGARCYKYNAQINSRPHEDFRGYQYVLGVDLGYEDDTSFVVGAWSHYDPVLHIVHVESKQHMILSEVEARIKQLQSAFGIGVIVIDGASKQGVEELETRFQLSFFRADKQGKKDFIELMNNDFLLRRINVLADRCKPLIDEWEQLIWDEKAREKGEWKEDRGCANHCADAALYMWRWCYNYAAIPKAPPKSKEQQIEEMLIARDAHDEKQEIIEYADSDLFGGF